MEKKMGEKRVDILRRSVLMVWLTWGLLISPSSASFQTCYETCFILCFLIPTNTAFTCSLKCLKDCIIPSSYVDAQRKNLSFCNLGCASSLCSNLSSKNNPASKKVGDCVDSCSDSCSKNYSLPDKN